MGPIRTPTSKAALLTMIGMAAPTTLLAQDTDTPLGLLLKFVEQDAKKVVPRQANPFTPGPFYFLTPGSTLEAEASEFFDPKELEARSASIVDFDEGTFMKVEGGYALREDGIHIGIVSVDRGDKEAAETGRTEGDLRVVFTYFVTITYPHGKSEICPTQYELIMAPTTKARGSWRIVKDIRRGTC